MRTGGIPTKIALYLKAPIAYAEHNRWNDQFRGQDATSLMVTPTMPTDADSAQQRTTAEAWASEGGGKGFTVVERDNKPFKVRIVGVEQRREGGRAWKAIIDNELLIDMREEVLLDCIIDGIESGGVPRGEFIFAREGSQMKIVRIGSHVHKDLEQANTRRKSSSISKSELKAGVLYRTRGAGMVYYLGRAGKNGQHVSMKLAKHDLDGRVPIADVVACNIRYAQNLHWSASLSVVEAAEEIALPADYAGIIRRYARDEVLRRLTDAAYGTQKFSDADKLRHTRSHLERVLLSIDFDPEAAAGVQSAEHAAALAAIEQFESKK